MRHTGYIGFEHIGAHSSPGLNDHWSGILTIDAHAPVELSLHEGISQALMAMSDQPFELRSALKDGRIVTVRSCPEEHEVLHSRVSESEPVV